MPQYGGIYNAVDLSWIFTCKYSEHSNTGKIMYSNGYYSTVQKMFKFSKNGGKKYWARQYYNKNFL